MLGVILAGGAGARLHPFTASKSKALIPLRNVPFYLYQLKLLHSLLIRDVVVVVYKGFRWQPSSWVLRLGLNLSFVEISERDQVQMWQPLLSRLLRQTSVVLDCDLLLGSGLKAVLDLHRSSGVSATMVGLPYQRTGEQGTDGSSWWGTWRSASLLSGISSEPFEFADPLHRIGVSITSESFWKAYCDYCVTHLPVDPWSPVFLNSVFATSDSVAFQPVEGYYRDVGTWQSLSIAETDLEQSEDLAFYHELWDGSVLAESAAGLNP